MSSLVLSGLDVLQHRLKFAPLRGRRIGLVTHTAAISTPNVVQPGSPRVNYCGRSAADIFASQRDLQLVALFGPEHGLHGLAQDLIPVAGETASPGVRVHSLYGDSFETLKPTPDQLAGLDVLVIDLQDVGSRYYTFQATMLYCLEAAAEAGLPVFVLDRPNPIGGVSVEGPALRPGFESFIGVHSIAVRHGMTIGELATLYRAERVPKVNLTIIPCEPYERAMSWRQTYLPWVPPSPNMPTVDTAVVYPGLCLVEGTNLSEGRGTTRPFEYVGFPGLDPQRAANRLWNSDLPGVEFLPVTFRPTFHKHAEQDCGGVFLLITNRGEFRPVRTGLAILVALRDLLGDAFQWRTDTYEFVSHIPAIDLLFGSDRERTMIDAGATWKEIAALWEPEEVEFRERRKTYLLYK